MGSSALVAVSLLWAGLVAGGFALLGNYEHRPGAAAASHPDWPAGTALQRAPDRPTILLFAHPRCPCTRASLENLDRFLARASRPVAVHVLFFEPPGASPEWRDTDLWRHAARMPGVVAHADEGGSAARRFGARTSGQVLGYDAAGRLRFRGGLTGSRGHAGDSAGLDALLAFAAGADPDGRVHAVFGCDLLGGEAP